MIYLTGVTNDRDEPELIAHGVGLMVQPGNSYHRRALRYPFYGADNGCFSDRWEEDRWLRWLEVLPRERCLFAVAPDVYPDAVATLERSLNYFGLIRELGFPAALVAQDGAERLDLPWDEFDCLFVGGMRTPNPADEWKTSAAAESLVRRARNAGKWCHMGRVNSVARLLRAREMGCQSADGTYLKYRKRRRAGELEPGPSRGVAELVGWTVTLAATPPTETFELPALPVHRIAATAA